MNPIGEFDNWTAMKCMHNHYQEAGKPKLVYSEDEFFEWFWSQPDSREVRMHRGRIHLDSPCCLMAEFWKEHGGKHPNYANIEGKLLDGSDEGKTIAKVSFGKAEISYYFGHGLWKGTRDFGDLKALCLRPMKTQTE